MNSIKNKQTDNQNDQLKQLAEQEAQQNVKPKKKSSGIKKIFFTDRDKDYIYSAVLNGRSLQEIAQYFHTTEQVFLKNLSFTHNREIKDKYKHAVSDLLAGTTRTIKRIAEGYHYVEKEYKQVLRPMAKEYFANNLEKFKVAVETNNFDAFMNLLMTGILNPEAREIKVYEKFAKPELGAIRDILRSFSPDTWDIEAKHKAIPATKIVVKVENQPQRKREIEPNYVIDSN